ncbi:hypothetical protein DRO61_04330 [Candidatus Bathyarchaeota archaeon]|nr:MAG: hypothetical protein DRO61_04330 [Candidatus Bathyarchaeota archaeon]
MQFLIVNAGVRYWEDGTINGKEDEDGSITPCKELDRWKPIIDIDRGEILNWTLGVKAEIHYKVCDDGIYILQDSDSNDIKTIEDYVPSILCPKDNGYGDYIIMDIDEAGFIKDWKGDLTDFYDEDED